MGKRIRFSVENQVDITLTHQTHILRTVLTRLAETQALEPMGQLRTLIVIDGELQKLDAVVVAGFRRREQWLQLRCGRVLLRQALAGFFFEVQQRAQTISSVGARRCGTKAVIEISSDNGPV